MPQDDHAPGRPGPTAPERCSRPAPAPRPEAAGRYLRTLMRRHRALDERIDREARAGLAPASRLSALKRVRLALKDRIAWLLARASSAPA